MTPILVTETGNCGPGELEDLDGNGTREFITCDDQFAYAYCSYADSPFPRVVYSYDTTRGTYVIDTPRYASHYRDQLAQSLDEAQTWLSQSGGKDPGLDKCRLLRPALGLMYSGRFSDGVALIRGLYRAADRQEFEREATFVAELDNLRGMGKVNGDHHVEREHRGSGAGEETNDDQNRC